MVFSWRNFFSAFFLLFILFFPTGLFSDFQNKLTVIVFGDITSYLSHLSASGRSIMVDFSSDSLSMYILVGLLLVIAFVVCFLKFPWRKTEAIIAVYLALVLLKYGLDKVFKSQFYLPEPNILYSRFGDLDRDILFWSLMGTSYPLSFVLGFIEIGVAIVLLIPKTMRIGSVLAFFTFLQIFLINLGFDISVKLFSLVLLGMALFLSFPIWRKLYIAFLKIPRYSSESTHYKRLFLAGKIFLVIWVLWQTIEPAIQRNHWNDDLVERPYLHGVYRNLQASDTIQYIFIHRDHYLIFMNENGKVRDYKFQLIGNHLMIRNQVEDAGNWQYEYSKKDSVLTLKNKSVILKAKAEYWKTMNALRPLFHFTIEEIN